MLLEHDTHGLRIAVANASARKLGVTPGLRFADARARAPHLLHEEIDRQADARALHDLATWLIRFAPLVAVDGADGLLLETTGCAHLYGGETGLLTEIDTVLGREGIAYRCGLAATPMASAALARAGVSGTCLAAGEEHAGLADLPVGALRLSEEAETLLRRFGLTRIGQLYGIDRKALARRFQSRTAAEAVLLRLDQALGLRHDPIRPLRPAPARTARLPCPEPLLAREAIETGLAHLAEDLCADLSAFGQGARGFTLLAYRTDGRTELAEITTARPVRSPKHILRLFAEKLDRIDPGFGIDLLVLEARRTGPMQLSAVALSGDLAARDDDDVALSALADRLTARLGEGSVTIRQAVESHIPERAEREAVYDGSLAPAIVPAPVSGPRPLRLLAQPEPVRVLAAVPDGPPLRFVWRRVVRAVARADGPERLSPEWWRHTAPPQPTASLPGTSQRWLAPKLDPRADAALITHTHAALMAAAADPGEPVSSLPRARDYYRVEDEAGRRYWLFRQGLYDDGRGGPPDWYMHGLFA